MKLAITLAAAVMALQTPAAKKYIFTGWALNDAGPQDILAYADLFDKTACDGVGVPLDPSGSPTVKGRFRLMEPPRWRDGVALVRIPDGANNLYVLLDAGKDEKVRKVTFKGLEIFRIK